MRCVMSKATTMRAVAAIFLALAATSNATRAETAQEIVAASDKVRNPGEPFRSTNTLTEFSAGKPRDQNVLVLYAKEDPATHQFRNLIRYTAPPRDQGKMVLLDGRVLWVYDPNSKPSVRIPPQQRLIGQAAIGDVLTVTPAIDYS